jgi:hypothetical protein
LKLAWTPSSLNGEFAVRSLEFTVCGLQFSVSGNRARRRFCSGHLLRRTLFFFAISFPLFAHQTPANTQTNSEAVVHRFNELSLAGIRPGRDSIAKAVQLYGKPKEFGRDADELSWEDLCFHQVLNIEKNQGDKIQTVRLVQYIRDGLIVDCKTNVKNHWRAGRGLSIWDSADRLLQLYGKPDSKSPSTRDGQPLELWYYAFDWAGPDVPQVMEVLCTTEKEGQPGRVIEITLAAPSL